MANANAAVFSLSAENLRGGRITAPPPPGRARVKYRLPKAHAIGILGIILTIHHVERKSLTYRDQPHMNLFDVIIRAPISVH